ncbi:unnamed protein product [Caenorhabditis sp. 36 PRJEB53466]|nr:unnamed protein product [Caenorhabditis sp. 36 PRJEB53466]
MHNSLILLLLFAKSAEFLFLWEPRTLKCERFDCFLLKNEQEGLKEAQCREEPDGKHICNLECDGADRDSVISKKPTDFRHCNRFFTYNTRKTSTGEWWLWRNSTCAASNITLSVHCAFPVNGQ